MSRAESTQGPGHDEGLTPAEGLWLPAVFTVSETDELTQERCREGRVLRSGAGPPAVRGLGAGTRLLWD